MRRATMNLFLLQPPSDLETFRARAAALEPTSPPLAPDGETPLPPGYVRDHNRVLLGRGPEAWRRAREALDAWRMFDLPWIGIHPERPRIQPGEVVVVVARQPLGLWVRNAAKIAWVTDSNNGVTSCYAFCYVTLPWHVERGAERFQVTRDRDTDEVWYDLLAHSRPGHWLTRLGQPWARRQQARFARGSLEAMARAR